MPAAREMTSTCPFVTGSYEPGQIAVITCSYTVTRVWPYLRLVRCDERQLRLDARVRLEDDDAVVVEHGGEVARELRLEVRIHVVRGVDQHEIVLPPLGREHRHRVLAQHRPV